MAGSAGSVRDADGPFTGETQMLNGYEREFGLRDGSLKATPSVSSANKADIAQPNFIGSLTTGWHNIQFLRRVLWRCINT